jgi:hypothetical protein
MALAALLAGGWWMYSHNIGPVGRLNHSNGSNSAHRLTPAGSLKVDKSNLPKNWQTATSSDDPAAVSASNMSKGSNPDDACQVSAVVIKDQAAHVDTADGYSQTLKDNLTQPLRMNSDYQFQDLPKQALTIKTEDGTKVVSAYYWKYQSPNTGKTNYDKVAFYIKDGVYARVTEFCAGTDFTTADKALAAMTVKFNN